MGNLSARGFTLIEVMVALCLLSLAALSIIDLQWRSLAATRQSALHGVAMQLALDMADNLRADDGSAAPTAPEHAAWLARIADALPSGRAVICRDPAPWDDAAGAYRWACAGDAGPLLIKIAWQEGGNRSPASPLVLVIVAPGRP